MEDITTMTELALKTDWGKNRITVKPQKNREDMKVSRTFYIKIKYLEYMDKNDVGRMEDGNLNYNQGLNFLLQHGVAHIEEQKVKNQTRLKDFTH